VIIIIGENRSFDHIFATSSRRLARPSITALRRHRQGRRNSRTELFALAAILCQRTGTYSNSPGGKTLYGSIPPVVTGGPPNRLRRALFDAGLITTGPDQIEPRLSVAQLLSVSDDRRHGTYRRRHRPDTRIPNDLDLPAVHSNSPLACLMTRTPAARFIASNQMWQQQDCDASLATAANPAAACTISFPWV